MAIAAQSMERTSAARERRWGRIRAASGLAFGLFGAVQLAARAASLFHGSSPGFAAVPFSLCLGFEPPPAR